ncbi:ABC transporter permease [Clostridium lacusfryxellense]|uniref:ABC transporter permease n=1 Tax=Clostridium lacusfryxellense TaxID=205328 RepID=UPI001C0D5B4D|nr:hypothetical protein [Clostridium lacusfryxellense]MBU3111423.1 hypothetical protein [Clostridium lacusfryxellense]
MRLKEYKLGNFVTAFFIIFAIWQIVAMIINRPLFPPPYVIIINIFQTFHSQIAIHAVYSLIRIIVGLLFTLLIGVPVGILMGYFKKIDVILSPIVYFSYPVPKIALLPIIRGMKNIAVTRSNTLYWKTIDHFIISLLSFSN